MRKIIALILFSGIVYSGYSIPVLDTSMTVQQEPTDSLPVQEDFVESIDSLYESNEYASDTFGWDNKMINSGHFNSAAWTDTARIVLVDSARKKYYYPPFTNYLTSDFGPRRRLWHYGVDIKLQKGDTVRAIFDGIVRVTKYDRRGYGHVVVLRHLNGLESIYGHLTKELVVINEIVKAGDPIGLGGNTGRSTGSHLHFEMRYYGEPINPNDIINFKTHELKNDTLVLTKANFEYLAELRKMKWMTVRKGDTLGHIAMRYHTSVAKLIKLNNIKRTTVLRVGQKLRYQ